MICLHLVQSTHTWSDFLTIDRVSCLVCRSTEGDGIGVGVTGGGRPTMARHQADTGAFWGTSGVPSGRRGPCDQEKSHHCYQGLTLTLRTGRHVVNPALAFDLLKKKKIRIVSFVMVQNL